MSNFELNQGDNFIFGVDVSASMQNTDCAGGMSRINFLKEKVGVFINEASKYDPDGIDLITFGAYTKVYSKVTAENATETLNKLNAIEPATMTHNLIAEAFRLHKQGGNQQTVLFIATDGEPSDQQAVKQSIISITNQVSDEREFNISFLTVGVVSASLRSFLDSLDDDLRGSKFDIVDVKALEDVDFLTAFSGALND